MGWNENVVRVQQEDPNTNQLREVTYLKTSYDRLFADGYLGPSKKLFLMNLRNPDAVQLYHMKKNALKLTTFSNHLNKYQCKGSNITNNPEHPEAPCQNKIVEGIEYCYKHLEKYFFLVIKQTTHNERLNPFQMENNEDNYNARRAHQLGVFATKPKRVDPNGNVVVDPSPVYRAGQFIFPIVSAYKYTKKETRRVRFFYKGGDVTAQTAPNVRYPKDMKGHLPYWIKLRNGSSIDMMKDRGVVGLIQRSRFWDKVNCYLKKIRLHKMRLDTPDYPNYDPAYSERWQTVLCVFALKDLRHDDELVVFSETGYVPSDTMTYQFRTIQEKIPNLNPRDYTHHLSNGFDPTTNYNRRRFTN